MRPMKRRMVLRELRKYGCTPDPNSTGPHEKWRCPCGKHIAMIPRHVQVKAGTVRVIQQDMSCLGEGWLQ